MVMPRHVAIILDGNGRWAKSKGMPRNYGHIQGAKTVEVICEEAYKMGIQYLTVYAFSTENWSRPKDEVDALMKLLRNYMKTCLTTAKKNRMCVRVLGDKTGLDDDIRTRIAQLEESTRDNDGLHFQIALNYGGRDEIVRAVKEIARRVEKGEMEVSDITEGCLSDLLDTGGLPEPDLLIRTCNEQRISNFLLWQLAYTEFYFTQYCSCGAGAYHCVCRRVCACGGTSYPGTYCFQGADESLRSYTSPGKGKRDGNRWLCRYNCLLSSDGLWRGDAVSFSCTDNHFSGFYGDLCIYLSKVPG